MTTDMEANYHFSEQVNGQQCDQLPPVDLLLILKYIPGRCLQQGASNICEQTPDLK